MRIKLWQSILLALVVSAVSLVLYRSLVERAPEPAVVVAPPNPVATAPAPEPVRVERAHEPRILPLDGVASCTACDQELANYRRNPGALAHRAALEVCVRRRCSLTDAQAQARFEDAVSDLRERNNERACAALWAVASEAPSGSIWSEKAQNLYARRCAE